MAKFFDWSNKTNRLPFSLKNLLNIKKSNSSWRVSWVCIPIITKMISWDLDPIKKTIVNAYLHRISWDHFGDYWNTYPRDLPWIVRFLNIKWVFEEERDYCFVCLANEMFLLCFVAHMWYACITKPLSIL